MLNIRKNTTEHNVAQKLFMECKITITYLSATDAEDFQQFQHRDSRTPRSANSDVKVLGKTC